jgi:hypothetical protein
VWRDDRLSAVVVRPGDAADARLERLLAAYPQPEALLGAVLLGDADPALRDARRLLLDALATGAPQPLACADAALQELAATVPVAWVADARLVSGRIRGWRRDALGAVDYTRVRALPRGRVPSPSR